MHAKLKKAHLTFVAAILAATGAVVAAQMPPSWVWPTFNTAAPVEEQLTMVDRYSYREQRYEPPVAVGQAVPKAQQRFATPEEAMISRVSAMMNGDYDGWLDTWDAVSRQLTIDNNQAMGRAADFFLQWWADTFQFAHFVLARRIETGPYVVITYRLETPTGEDAGNGIEYPVVFHQVEGRWLATLELREDPLVPASPWISGETRMELTVR